MRCFNCGLQYERTNTLKNVLKNKYQNSLQICNNCMNVGYLNCTRCQNKIFINSDGKFNGIKVEENIFCNKCLIEEKIIDTIFSYKRDSFNGYCYKPYPTFTPYAKNKKQNLYLGVELELGLGNSYADVTNFCNNHNDNIFYFKSDCSIHGSGVEVVTHPCTAEVHKSNSSGWEKLLTDARKINLRSDDRSNTGMHVHLSKSFFTDKEQRMIDMFINLYSDIWKKISQRSSSYAEYSIKRHNDWGRNNSRYSSVNYHNDHTIELRIFRGSNKYEVVMAIIEICNMLGHFIKQINYETLYENKTHVLQMFKDMVYSCEFASEFCEKNNVFK